MEVASVYTVIGVVKSTGKTVRVERKTPAAAFAVWEDFDRNGWQATILFGGQPIDPDRLRHQPLQWITRPFGW